MDTKVKVESLTSTHQAVLISTLMIGAFFVGLSMLLTIRMIPVSDSDSISAPAVEYAQPLKLKDILTADMAGSLPNETNSPVLGDITISNYQNDGTKTTLGTFPIASGNGEEYFRDGAISPTATAIVIEVDSPLHPAIIMTLTTPLSSGDSASAGFGIKRADAQVNLYPRYTICIPEDTDPLSTSSTYFADTDGNTYNSMTLHDRLNPVACPELVSKSFSPDDITGISANPTFSLPSEGHGLVFMKSWKHPLGLYNPQYYGYYDLDEDTDALRSPLIVYAAPNVSIPKTSITVQMNSESKTLCYPAQANDADSFSVVYYDRYGKPYQDLWLTSPIPCSTATNSCASINCAKYPKHACCIAIPQSSAE